MNIFNAQPSYPLVITPAQGAAIVAVMAELSNAGDGHFESLVFPSRGVRVRYIPEDQYICLDVHTGTRYVQREKWRLEDFTAVYSPFGRTSE